MVGFWGDNKFYFTERNYALLTQSDIACYRKNQNPLFVKSKRNPNCIVKTSNRCHLLHPFKINFFQTGVL